MPGKKLKTVDVVESVKNCPFWVDQDGKPMPCVAEDCMFYVERAAQCGFVLMNYYMYRIFLNISPESNPNSRGRR